MTKHTIEVTTEQLIWLVESADAIEVSPEDEARWIEMIEQVKE